MFEVAYIINNEKHTSGKKIHSWGVSCNNKTDYIEILNIKKWWQKNNQTCKTNACTSNGNNEEEPIQPIQTIISQRNFNRD